MRPSEAAAVKWENISDGVLKMREAAPYGVLGPLKTKKNSKRDLTITEPLTSLLAIYREALGNPTGGLLFQNGGGQPINHNGFAKYYIKPFAEKVCKRWNGCYSGRHGAATSLYNLTGDVRAAYQNLGNSFEVAFKNYVRPDVEQGRKGQAKYAKALLKAMKKDKK
jgi:integrase